MKKPLQARTVAPQMRLFQSRLRLALDAAKKLRGWSQSEVASRAGVDKSVITKTLNNEEPPIGMALNTVLLLASVLKCNFMWLATGQGAPGLESQDDVDHETPKPSSSVQPKSA